MDMKWWIVLLFTINVLTFGQCYIKQDLTGHQWKISNGNHSINVQGTVPGGIYSDLMSAGVIQDIYYRFNDIKYRWIANETWIYSYTFKADNEHFNKNITNLVFDGLDTFSTVYLNGNVIGNSSNMFVRYAFNISPYLKPGKNNLTIRFQSSVYEARKLFEAQAKQYPILPVCVPPEYNGECHANHIRKMQAAFSWDWGPAFPSVGIWKPVYIESYDEDSAVLRDVTVNVIEQTEEWRIYLKLYYETNIPNSYVSGRLTTVFTTDTSKVITTTSYSATADVTGECVQNIQLVVPKADVSLWWPNGYGKQHLYNLTLIYVHDDDHKTEPSVKSIRIGFRKIELIQNDLGRGLSFYFKVNGVAIFAKGSNWIPANILPEQGADSKRIRFLLESARDVHMNMLRVWGGGVYESDEFYSIADELGILIWQDFMFACSMYPVNESFLKSVRIEVKQQVRRLQHHASIALWAGNNENEAALQGNWYGTRSNYTVYKQDYITLYVNTVREQCLANDDTREFLVSSPTNGLQSEKEGYIAKNPYDTHYGDIHYYNYIMDGWDKSIYLKTRFASEYGFQSLPAVSTLLSSTNVTADLKFNSEFLNSRQHHKGGYLEMAMLIKKHLKLPDETKENYLQTYSYYSQISQAMAVKAQTEFYREGRSTMDAEGNGLTMGALYWQLNDVWPAPSWSSIDFRQKWKMLHYYARHFFAPVIMTANISPARLLTLYAISDLTTFTSNATVTVAVYKWSNLKPIYTENNTINFLPGHSSVIVQFGLDGNLQAVGCGSANIARNYCLLYFSLYDSKGERLGPDSFLFPTAINNAVGLASPNLLVRVSKGHDSTALVQKFNLTITTDNIALFVWLEATDIDGIFSDNGFMQVTKYKTIQFDSAVPISAARLQSSLKITSLMSKEHM